MTEGDTSGQKVEKVTQETTRRETDQQLTEQRPTETDKVLPPNFSSRPLYKERSGFFVD